ncbi:THAP domain-containing protein 6-like isoform 2-T2 [Odontesthes bonariensis]|uniref:THAP domain-containing protein 6-like isoform X2 n=1 Tax=Odontesthes bonariensis TaxID=219752 RepID=UPI003F58A213
MPVFCAAYGCNNRRSIDTKSRGITFHKFPSDAGLRRQWEVAIRREGFVATQSSKLCSEHFKPEDFDRTGQTVRLRDGASPFVLNFPSHLQTPVVTRKAKTSRKAAESLPVDLSQHSPESEPQPSDDHSYAFPNSPTHLKARLSKALARVKSLEREKQKAKARERRAEKTIKSLLEDLKKKNPINKELKEKLDFHSDFPQQHIFKEKETLADQGVCNQEESSNFNQEEPEPQQIKEDLDKLFTTQQGELPVSPVDEQRDHSETDSMSEQLLPPSSPQAESRDELGSKLLETLQMWTPQIKLRRIDCNSHP